MSSTYGQPNRKKFDHTPMSDLVFASANIIDLAGYNTPEMAMNVKTTKEWRTNDPHQSLWRLETILEPNPDEATPYNGASPVEYKLHLRTIGSKACFVYRSNAEWMGTLNEGEKTSQLMNRETQDARIPELLQGLNGFPKDLAIAEYPIMESWPTHSHEQSGVAFNSNMFDTIILRNYGIPPHTNNASPKTKRRLTNTIRNWYGIGK